MNCVQKCHSIVSKKFGQDFYDYAILNTSFFPVPLFTDVLAMTLVTDKSRETLIPNRPG
jgi:hypothetical protein